MLASAQTENLPCGESLKIVSRGISRAYLSEISNTHMLIKITPSKDHILFLCVKLPCIHWLQTGAKQNLV